MRQIFLLTLFSVTFFYHSSLDASGQVFLCAGRDGGDVEGLLPSSRVEHFLVIFAKFKDEAPGEVSVPTYTADLFEANFPESFAGIIGTDSLGAITAVGECLTRVYESNGTVLTYLDPDGSGKTYGQFNLDILYQVDTETDFGRYDNDGPDGLPNSGDDDGYVDFLFINLKSAPRNFLRDGEASGIPSLGFSGEYVTDDPATGREGETILIDGRRGTTQIAGDFHFTVGAMLHEYGHLVSRELRIDRKRFDVGDLVIWHGGSPREIRQEMQGKAMKGREEKKRRDQGQEVSSQTDTLSERGGQVFQNYPNPFNTTTSIRYVVQRHGHVSLAIHNLLGQEVVRLVEAFLRPGEYSVEWDGKDASGKDVPSGIYFCRIKIDDFIRYQRVVLMR
jgi:hypothetical protein